MINSKVNVNRRKFIVNSAAVSAISVIPFASLYASEGGDVFESDLGQFMAYPIEHASIVFKTPKGVIYADPVGDVALYAAHPNPDLILITHEHGDHFNLETLAGLIGDNTKLITNPSVFEMLDASMQAKASMLKNGEQGDWNGVKIDAIAAYNTTEERKNFHPQGRDNGYVVDFDGFRIYISGDSEDVPEMRAITDIDVMFLCMNLPFTMTAEAAASAVADIKPKFVYPYHWRGKDGGTQDPAKFAELVGETAEVNIADWYPE